MKIWLQQSAIHQAAWRTICPRANWHRLPAAVVQRRHSRCFIRDLPTQLLRWFRPSPRPLRVQHSEKREPISSCGASAFAVYRRNFLSRLTATRSTTPLFSNRLLGLPWTTSQLHINSPLGSSPYARRRWSRSPPCPFRAAARAIERFEKPLLGLSPADPCEGPCPA